MPNLNDQVRRLWDKTTHMVGGGEARASFLQEVDKDGDGKVTAGEIKAMVDDNRDGYLDSSEIEKLSIKATASEFDRTTIKAMVQAANALPHVVLFEAEAPPAPKEPVTVANPAADPAAPAADSTQIPLPADPHAGDKPEDPAAATPAADSTVAAPVPATPVAPPAPPALKTWNDSKAIGELKDSYKTRIPVGPRALPSRDLEALKEAKAGLFRLQDQVGNSCGTTSLSMLLKYYQGHTLENSVPTIDKHIRAQGKLELNLPGGLKSFDIDGFTAARSIVDYANAHGMRAGMKNNASVSDLKPFLDKGVPLLVLTDWNFEEGYETPSKPKPDGKSLHYVTVVGYEYKTNPETQKREMYLNIGNPWGVLQTVSESDFTKVWSKVQLEIPGKKKIDTGYNRLFVAMVPRDEDHSIVAPNGSVLKAGSISVPTGDDGFKGWVAKKTSDVLQKAGEFQDDIAQRSGQLSAEMASGYDREGIKGALKNLWGGDQQEIANLRAIAKRGNFETKAHIINELLEKSVNRGAFQTLVYDILKDAPFGKEFDQLLDQLDTRRLAQRLSDQGQSGKVMAWIAKSEIDRKGQTGPKFEAFASYQAINHRDTAINTFLADENTVKGKLFQKIPASLVRDAVKKLAEGITDGGEEKAIYNMLKVTSWSQFDQVMSRLDMASLAGELEDDKQLGDVLSWAVELGTRTGNWNNVSEILNHLNSVTEFGRADNLVGHALTRQGVANQLHRIPAHIRTRMIDLLDDMTRLRTSDAITALNALRKIK